MSQAGAFVAPGLQLSRQRGGRQVGMALQEPIEAAQIARLGLVAVAKRLDTRDVLSHGRAKSAAPIRQRPQSLQGALVVVFQQGPNNRVQEPAVLSAQLREQM